MIEETEKDFHLPMEKRDRLVQKAAIVTMVPIADNIKSRAFLCDILVS